MDDAKALDEATAAPTVVKLNTPTDILGMLPHRLGFHPHESLVAISLRGPRLRDQLVLRADLPTREDEDTFVRHIAGQLDDVDSDGVVLVCYTDEPPPARSLQRARMVRQLKNRLRELNISLVDALLVHRGSWWSYVCDDPACCPAAGSPVPEQLTPAALQYAAESVARGGVVRDSRAALAASVEAAADVVDVEPGEDPQRLALEGHECDEDWWTEVACSGAVPPVVAEVVGLRARWAAGQCSMTDVEARGVARDLWGPMARLHCMTLVLDGPPEELSTLVALFTELARRTPDRLAGPLCALLAWFAHAAGDGALALVASERSVRCQPDNTLAEIVLGNISAMQRPSYVKDCAARIRDSLGRLSEAG